MRIEDNEQAYKVMENYIGSTENRMRSLYNYGYKDGYKQGLEDATKTIIDKVMEQMEIDQ